MEKSILKRVVDCVAVTTRYPVELLSAGADLENDLGIDSVKNLEIVLALADEFRLDLAAQGRDATIRTIGHVAEWIEGLLQENAALQARQMPGEPAPDCQENCQPPARLAEPVKAPHFHSTPRDTTAPTVRESQPTLPSSGKSLEGRIALVTGSGRGVGRSIARMLAARGATVVVNSFHSRELGEQTASDIRAQGGKAVHLWGSIANPGHVDRIFAQIDQQFGQLDILVCNASDGRIGSFLELTTEDWERAFRTNVSGHHQCALKALELMRVGGGSIVTMSAVGAHSYIAGLGSQGVVKAAVESLTRYLACELGQYGIRVNCVAGGPVYGDLLSKFPNAQSVQEHWESITADGQLCSPMDLANAIGFLVSDEARGINGAVWMVDHGFSAIADGRPLRGNTRSLSPIAVV